jgi:DUF4097 and DUF4098 domain-containing protein YvlB
LITMHEFPVTGPLTTDIRIGDGRVDVTAEAGVTTATVTVEPLDNTDLSRDAAARTTVELQGKQLSIKTPEISTGWLRRRGARVGITVVVPADGPLELRTASADATCSGTYRLASVHTASGDVFIETVTGDLSVNAASGDVRIMRVNGDLKANSASGDVSADTIDGSATIHTASGDVEIGTIGAGLRANSASGDVRVGTLRRGAAKVNSASGDISVRVVPGIGVWMDLTSMSGRARSELDPASAPANGAQPEVSLHLRSMSGDVVVGRAA